MLVLLYVLAAVASAALALRVPRDERGDAVYRELARLTWVLVANWFTWALYLVSRSIGLGTGDPVRLLNGVIAVFVPWALLRFVVRLFWTPGSRPDPMVGRLARSAPVVAVVYLILGVWWARGHDGQGPGDFGIGVYTFFAFIAPLHRIWRVYRTTPNAAERARVRYLLGLAAAAIGFSSLEALLRGLVTLSKGSSLGQLEILDFVKDLQTTLGPIYSGQGPFPPLGALFATLCLYFLYQIVSMSRLLELNEIFARLASVALQSAVLLSVLVVLVGAAVSTMLSGYPQQALYEAFIACCLLVLGQEPLRAQLDAWMDRVLRRRSQLLNAALTDIEEALERVIALDPLVDVVLGRLVNSGRIPYATMYVWDEERRTYQLVGERGDAVGTAVPRVPRQPFAEGFGAGEHVYVASELRRAQQKQPQRSEALENRRQTLEAMGAEVVVPFLSGDVVLGWVGLRDEASSDGFARDELQGIHRSLQRAASVLENLSGFDALKEDYRLAALGTMSAGLAHEIRNPLAAIKGAAQLIRKRATGTDGEMVDIVVHEVDRLNVVVTQFLDYARPLQLFREPSDLAELVRHTIRLLNQQAQGEVTIEEEVEPELPPISVDAGKIVQVLLNLGRNGLEAIGGSGRLRFEVQGANLRDPKARNAPALEVRVVDTGRGIAPEDLDKLFVPFFTTRHDGTGLGLAISRRIIREHGGELDVESALTRGTTFTVRLPLDG